MIDMGDDAEISDVRAVHDFTDNPPQHNAPSPSGKGQSLKPSNFANVLESESPATPP
jgi:hypothetical protein